MEDQDRLIVLLKALNRFEPFQEWRDIVAKPEITRLEAELSKPEDLSEANIKAKVMNLNYVKNLFYRLFEAASAQEEVEQAN